MARSGRGTVSSDPGIIVADVTSQVLCGADLSHRLGTDADGAILVFEGRVRDHDGGRRVVRLHYEVYEEMAVDLLRQIAGEALERFDIGEVGVRHRVGTLEPGAVSLVVAIAAPRRRGAYEASRYVIEELKRRLPIWKKEEYGDGTSRWLEGQVEETRSESEA